MWISDEEERFPNRPCLLKYCEIIVYELTQTPSNLPLNDSSVKAPSACMHISLINEII